MDIPDYIKTEWRSVSQSTLHFTDSSLFESCDEPAHSIEYIEPFTSDSKYGFVQCFISTLNIWEYQDGASKLFPKRICDLLATDQTSSDQSECPFTSESLPGINSNILEENDLPNPDVAFEFEYDENMPPGISSYHWALWKRFWHGCLPRYVELAWTHRFRDIVKEEYSLWHDEYILTTPEIIPHLEYNLNTPLKTEEELKSKYPHLTLKEISCLEEKEVSGRKLFDEVYEEFSEKRQWAHFRIFLKQIFLNPDERLKAFLENNGVIEEPAFDVHQYKAEMMVQDESTLDKTLHVTEAAKVVEVEIIEKDDIGSLKPDEQNETPQEAPTVNGSFPHNEAIEDSKSTLEDSGFKESHQVDHSESSEQPTKKHPKKKKKKAPRMPKSEAGVGVGWALKHLQMLNHEHSKMSSNEMFKFGTEDVPPPIAFLSTSQDSTKLPIVQELSPHPNRSLLKRKHDQDDPRTFSPQENILPVSKPDAVGVFSVFRSYFKMIFGTFIKGFMAFLGIPLLRYPFHTTGHLLRVTSYPFSALFSLLSRKVPDAKVVQKSLDEKNMNFLRNRIRPILRRLPAGPVIPDTMLVNVCREENIRERKEELVQVINEVDGEEDKSHTYSFYLTEKDCDKILEEIIDIPVTHKAENHALRTHTIFDEEGNPQTVVKVHVDDAKKRILDTDANFQEVDKHPHFVSDVPVGMVVFDDEGNHHMVEEKNPDLVSMHSKISKILRYSTMMQCYNGNDCIAVPEDIPMEVRKYWHQRFRLFLKFDEGIKLDKESWYSATPEILAAHQAERCRCDVVIDGFCGAGGNAIQLASSCSHVIAIDIDPEKLALARHNAEIYGVSDRIEFILGDFFDVAPNLKADAVFLSPPWGGLHYNSQEFYDIFTLGGVMDGKKLIQVASKISSNVAIYLPRSSNIYQIIEVAGMMEGKVDLEFAHIANKRKCLTAYFGDLVYFSIDDNEEEE